ncbi:pimeloyl-ACP methyl ester carboxylesterase [Neorhizobium huautlense]|uniref:Pimeloyl-ACP methyl ester carboxylesterase n=1 Tax=Neorhizobium huautlense TaxID=67774 RepID=A0ABT9Q1H1_9HYPH|nr:alpha/beta hydrolase [Neorhizobium huautlense]MDP9840571.1 pimeloyl-ACP methyl ester carboxylesterase [Neorhizobium huautlense]
MSVRSLTSAVMFAALACTALPAVSVAQERPTYGPRLEGFEYPFKTEVLNLDSQGQKLEMVFMDIAAEKPNGRTVVLLHGKNFCGATWEGTISQLSNAGYRVIAPDQVGFCKSSKPESYQFSFHQLAQNTKALLESRGIDKATVIGHSMGGMLATRFTLMYPETTEQMVLVNPIGLEDWKARGVPYQTIEAAFEGEKKTSFDSIKTYQQKFYYSGEWKPEYDKWVQMGAGMYGGEGGDQVAWNQALTSDMVFTQPVVHEFAQVKVPTLLMIGMTDKTAPGANRAPEEIAATLGDYTQLGKDAAKVIPGARLVEFEDLGHSPQIQAPERFHEALLEGLKES